MQSAKWVVFLGGMRAVEKSNKNYADVNCYSKKTDCTAGKQLFLCMLTWHSFCQNQMNPQLIFSFSSFVLLSGGRKYFAPYELTIHAVARLSLCLPVVVFQSLIMELPSACGSRVFWPKVKNSKNTQPQSRIPPQIVWKELEIHVGSLSLAKKTKQKKQH